MTQRNQSAEQLFAGNSEMAMRMRSHDWSKTPLGAVETWSQSLKTAVRITLTSRQPMFVWWGEDLTNLYNDAYSIFLRSKHPAALGQPAASIWREVWEQIEPRIESAIRQNEGTFDEAFLFIMERNGFPEETYVTFSYSPIPDDQGGTGGLLCACTDESDRIIGERQVSLLKELAANTADARTFDEACTLSANCLKTNLHDLPFALIYLVEAGQHRVVLAGTSGIERTHPAVPERVSLDAESVWSFSEVIQAQKPVLVSNLAAQFGDLPTGAWDRAPDQAIVVPIAPSGQTGQSGILIAGLNPLRLFDDNYRSFIDLVAGQISASIANANAYEAERQRAEQLAELDRAKTVFFSNISHEFRTPLTLMLNPLEDLLGRLDERLQPDEREQFQLIQRNGLRLQKLVNTLLDFSRIEAGRVQASYEPTDLATYTAELASAFRSLIERAGMALQIDCPALPEAVYVDREMWEKIVLNLISNAFKFTFTGGITVRLQAVGDSVELSVADTGVGIPEAELPRLFERFHRVSGTRSRTYEGSGIGLALVQELVKLHGGTICVTSQIERGTTFTIAIPLGVSHLPSERIQSTRTLESTALSATPYVEEASRWLSEPGVEPSPDLSLSVPTTFRDVALPAVRILLVDDNADMRDYLKRLLSQHYDVETAVDGLAALTAVRHSLPDLILTDVMMPGMDGFELLRSLRSDPTTQDVSIILLSARAGEEARIEGLAAGADDYLIKPFSARELMARVEAALRLAKLRRETTQALQHNEERYRAFIQQSSEGIWCFEVDPPVSIDCSEDEQIQRFYQHGYLAECNHVVAHMYGVSAPQELIGARLSDFLIPSDPRNIEYLRAFIRANYRLVDAESFEVDQQGNPKVFLNNLIGIVEAGKLVRAWGTQRDITERRRIEDDRKRAEANLRESEARYRLLAEAIPQFVWMTDAEGLNEYVNQRFCEYTGLSAEQMHGLNWLSIVHPEDLDMTRDRWLVAVRTGQFYEVEYRFRAQNGSYRWFLGQGIPLKDEQGRVRQWFGTCTDIELQKQVEQARLRLLEQEQTAREQAENANRIKDEFLAVLSHELRSPLNPILGWTRLLQNGKLDETRRTEALKTIERNAKLQTQLIEDLLDISRIMQGKLSLTAAPVSLTFVISAALETVRLAAEAKQIQLQLDFDSTVSPISGDAARLQQVVWNLLSNAVKFTPTGGQVTVELRQLNHLAQIRVIDTGKGINPRFLPYMFEYFRQEDGSTTRQFGGLGLGLAIARQIVELHGGTVWAESLGEGQGATFVVQLPAMQVAPIVSEPVQTQLEAKQPLKDVHILLVDDESDARELQAFLLEQSGASVTTVASGLEALQVLEQSIPDVLVSDIGMAEMDGYMLLQHIRSRPSHQSGLIPAIALTAYAAEVDQQRALQAGFQTHITKPVEPAALVRAIAELLNPA